ncbi:hypothetical protein RRSWK_03244 [Rhodopirellula sp. SWK7]|nr:hypothetical protein RRSWK_03244 [Rhodopirellula sp. SWK7]
MLVPLPGDGDLEFREANNHTDAPQAVWRPEFYGSKSFARPQ